MIEDDTLFSQDVLEVNLGLCEGPIAGLVHGPHTFYLGGTALVSKAGESNFDDFALGIYHGDAEPTAVKNTLGGTASATQVGVTLATATPVTRTTDQSLRGQIDSLEVRILIQQLYQITRKGDQKQHTVEFAIRYRKSGETTWKNFGESSKLSVTGKTTGGYVKEFSKKVDRISSDWEIQVELLSDDSDTDLINVVAWESFQMVNKTDREYPNLAVVRAVARVTDQISGTPEFYGVFAAKVVRVPSNFDPLTRVYSGDWDGTFKMAHTDSLVWCIYDLLVDELYGFKSVYPNLKVDRFSAYAVARWCDQLVPRLDGGYQPRYTFNYSIAEPNNARELVVYLCGVAGIVLSSDLNGSVRFKCDMPGNIVQVFGQESVVDGVFNYQFGDISERINDVTVRFSNPNLGWEQDFRRVTHPEGITKFGRIPKEYEAIGCADPDEASRRGRRLMIQANTELCTVSFQTTRLGMGLEVYDLIGISDPDPAWGLTGRVKSVSGTTIYLRDKLMVPTNTDLLLSLQTSTGVAEVTVRSAASYTDKLVIQGGEGYPSYAPEQAQFSLTSPGVLGLIKPFRVLTIEPDTDNPEIINISAREHNASKYSDADNGTDTPLIDYSGDFSVFPPATPVFTVATAGVRVERDGQMTYQVYAEWNQPEGAPAKSWLVYSRLQGEDTFSKREVKEQKVYLSQTSLDEVYELAVQAVGWTGKRSAMSDIRATSKTSTQKTPNTPMGWTGRTLLNAVVLTPPGGEAFKIPAGYSYRVYGAYAGETFGASKPVTTSATVPIRIEDTDYTRFFITAIDRYQNESAASSPIDVAQTTVSLTTPDQIGGVSVTSSIIEDGRARVVITWGSSTLAASYRVGVVEGAHAEAFITCPTARFSFDTFPGTTVQVRVCGINSLGKAGPWSTTATHVAARDTTPPATPTGLELTMGFGGAWLEWKENTEGDFDFYELLESTSSTPPTSGTSPSYRTVSAIFSTTGLNDGVRYYYWVRAVDSSGNRSPWSVGVNGKTVTLDEVYGAPDVPGAPTLSTALRQDGAAVVTIAWTEVAGATGYVIGVTAGLGNEVTQVAPSTPFELVTLPGETISVRLKSIGGTGLRSNWSPSATISAARDTTPPPDPTGVTGVAGIGGASISWGAVSATDLDRYEVYYASSSTPPVAGTTPRARALATTLLISGLTEGASYWFWVRAVDTSGNASAWVGTGQVQVTSVQGKIQQAIADASWAQDLGFISVVTGASLPTTNRGKTISWGGKIYTWDGSKYISAADFSDLRLNSILGQISEAQITPSLQSLITSQGVSAAADKAAAEAAALAATGSASAAQGYASEAQQVKQGVDENVAEITQTAGVVAIARTGAILASGNERFQFELEGWNMTGGGFTNLEDYAVAGVLPIWVLDFANNVSLGATLLVSRSTAVSVSINGTTYQISNTALQLPVVSGQRFLKVTSGDTLSLSEAVPNIDRKVTKRDGSITISKAISVGTTWTPGVGEFLSIIAWPKGTLP